VLSGRQWVIDPIDGTKNYVRGVPVWATLIALMVEGEVVVGVVSAPALGRRWWASAGGGAFTGKTLLQGTPSRVSGVSDVADASLSYSSVHGWVDSGRGQQFVDLMRDCWRTRAYGDFWSYMLVAEGAVDLAAEPALALHDMAAVAARGARFVFRQPGSGTRLLTEHLLAEQGLAAARLVAADAGAEDSHLAVAAAVAAGIGDCGLGIEAAARQFGLDFAPLVEEDYFLVCLTPLLEEPPVRALRALLLQPRWAELLATLPGYQPAHAGEVLSLTRALPWWRFRTPRKPAPGRGAKKVPRKAAQ